MTSNKKARLTMQLLSDSDTYRSYNKRLNNNVIISLWGIKKLRNSTVIKKVLA